MNSRSVDLQLDMLLGSARQLTEAMAPHAKMWGVARVPKRRALASMAILLGMSLMVAVVFVAIMSGIWNSAPAQWTHALLALIVAQSAIMVGVGIRSSMVAEARQQELIRAARAQARLKAETVMPTTPPPLPVRALADRLTLIGRGEIGGRPYVQLGDGSYEVETLLGRRRFGSLDAAEEFLIGRAQASEVRAA